MIVIFGISIQELQKTVHAKQKNKINFGTKIALFGYFGLQVWKSIVIFEISILEFVKMQSFVQYSKSLTLGPKMSDLGVFRLQF